MSSYYQGSDSIELVYGRPIDYARFSHQLTLASFDSRKLVKVYRSIEEGNYVVMSWHCLHAEYHKDSFASGKEEAVIIATGLFHS